MYENLHYVYNTLYINTYVHGKYNKITRAVFFALKMHCLPTKVEESFFSAAKSYSDLKLRLFLFLVLPLSYIFINNFRVL
jgi:hypothetical protein